MNIIFSDGSFKTTKNDRIPSICGSGTVVRTLSDKKQYMKSIPLPDSTNNYAELNAIHEGLCFLNKHDMIKEEPLIIVTDSKYAVTVLTDTMILEGKKGIEKEWKTKDGSRLKNQKLIKKIYSIIIDDNGDIYQNIKFVHVNSHLNEKKKEDLERIIHKFKQVGIKLSEEGAKSVILLNTLADQLANKAAESLLKKQNLY